MTRSFRLEGKIDDADDFIGTVTVTNVIGSNDHFAPSAIADQFWTLYTERNTPEIVH